MSIGIMDADFSKYILVPFNLEAMKISAYYKKKNQIVVLAPDFTPDRHQQFFFRKDYDDGNYPLALTLTPNVEYGGLAFTHNKYIPLPEDIEKMKPDTSLYARAENIIMNTASPNKKKIYNNLVNSEHCRLSLDGKTIWKDFERQFHFLKNARNLMLHDFDLGQVENSFETVQQILGRARTDGWATKIGMKFPIQIYDGQSLLNWSSLNSNSTFYSLQYNGVIDDEAFMDWVGKCKQRAIYTQMDYVVTSSRYDENHFTQVLLPKIFRQVLISRSLRIFFSLKYDEDYFSDKHWATVLRLFNFYMTSMSSERVAVYVQKDYDDTLFKFAKSTCAHPEKRIPKYNDFMTRSEIRETFAFVKENNYELFKDFYELTAQKLGGTL